MGAQDETTTALATRDEEGGGLAPLNPSGGLWSLVGPVVGGGVGLVSSVLAGLDPKVTAALVAGVAGLGGAVANGLLASRLQGRQAESARALEDHKRDIAKQLADQQRQHDKGLAGQQRVHDKELAAVRSELRGVETEAEQLRAHSLGLEAQRWQAFEVKRAEVYAEVYAAIAGVLHAYARLKIVAGSAHESGKGDLLREQLEAQANDCGECSVEAANLTSRSSLYLSPRGLHATKSAFAVLGPAGADLAEYVKTGDARFAVDFGPAREALEHLRRSLRSDLLPAAETSPPDETTP